MSDVNITPVSHVFDETGTLAENYIENEQRVLAQTTIRALCTRYGAFFVDTFVMRDGNNNPVDPSKFQFGLFAEELSEKTGKEIASAVVITDPTVIGPVYVDYHCVGGPWGVSNEQIIDLFTQLQSDTRPVTWQNILGKPDGFKPAHHFQDIGDLFGAEYFVEALERLTNAYLMGDNASHDEILRQIDALRTYVDTQLSTLNDSLKAYIDAGDARVQGNVDNLSTHVDNVQASLQAEIDTTNTRITTVQSALQASIDSVNQALATHVAAQGNVHNLTAAELGVYTTAQVDQLIANVNNNLGNYVKKNAAEDLSLINSGGMLYVYLNGVYRVVWPPQWQ